MRALYTSAELMRLKRAGLMQKSAIFFYID